MNKSKKASSTDVDAVVSNRKLIEFALIGMGLMIAAMSFAIFISI